MLNKIIFFIVFSALFLFDFACFVYGFQEQNGTLFFIFFSSPLWLGYITAKLADKLKI